jgi:nitrogen fixation protein FixH
MLTSEHKKHGGKEMKKSFVTVVSLIFVITGIAFAKDYEVKKKAGDFNVEIAIDKNPPAVGKNHMTIDIKDPSGKSVTDAKVKVEYSMPAMPGMPAMNYKTNAELKDGKYTATMDLPMAGSWNVTVKITRGGKTSKAKFSIDV